MRNRYFYTSLMVDQKTLAVFRQNWSEALRSARRLKASLQRAGNDFPLSAERLRLDDEDLFERLDAFRVRFADLQDTLGHKLFRGILLLELEETSNVLDTLNKMTKRRLLNNVEQWHQWRMIRNGFSHDYPDCEQERAEALNAAWVASDELLFIMTRMADYLSQQHGIELDRSGLL